MNEEFDVTIDQNNVEIFISNEPEISIFAESQSCSTVTDLPEDENQISLLQAIFNGSAGSSSGLDFIVNDIPTGTINGINTLFTLTYDFVSSKLWIYLNGLKLYPDDYALISPNQIQFQDAPLPGDRISVNYFRPVMDGGIDIGIDELFELDSGGNLEPKE